MYEAYRKLTAVMPANPVNFWRPAINALASVLVAALVISGCPVGSVSFADTKVDEGYLLDSGDTLRVRVHEWPGFDGDIVVGADGTVGLPIIGRVKATGRQVSRLANDIAERLRVSSNLSNPPSVVVSIVKYRAFFILGDVVTPGEYEFRPELTVLKAVSIAGGYFRPPDTSSVRDIILARSELQTNRRLVHRGLVELARIEAETEGQEEFEIPAELAPYADGPDLKALIEREREILSANLLLQKQKIATFEGLSKIVEREIVSLQKQLDTVSNQLKIAEKEAARVRNMASRGLTNADRVTSVELSLSRIERSRQELQTAIIRSRLSLHREQRRAEELKAETAKGLRDEQQATLSTLKEARVLQQRSEQLLLAAEVTPPRGFQAGGEEKVLRKFTLVRATEDGTTELNVEPFDKVNPGDVINVKRLAPVIDGKTALQPSASSVLGAKVSTTAQR